MPRLAGWKLPLAAASAALLLSGCEGGGDRSLYSILTGAKEPPAAPATPVAQAPAETPAVAPAPAPAEVESRRPYVTVRATAGDLAADQAFANAIRQARAERADAGFEVVAVAPRPADWTVNAAAGAAADRQAEQVLRALKTLGVPPEKIALAGEFQRNLPSSEVRIYLH